MLTIHVPQILTLKKISISPTQFIYVFCAIYKKKTAITGISRKRIDMLILYL